MPGRGLTEAQWACVHEILRQERRIWKWDSAGLRNFTEAVYFVLRTGIAWADLPAGFGPSAAARRRFRRWAAYGVWERVFRAVTPGNTCPDALLIDSTACKVHRCAMGDSSASIGKTRGGHNTKIHAGVEPDGTVRSVELTLGNTADCTMLDKVLGGLRPRRVVADKGYDTAACRARVRAVGAVPAIPSRRTARVKCPVRRKTYAGRHVVENFFCRIKDFGRVATRRDKSDVSYRGFVLLAAALLNMKLGWTTVLLA